jgi:alpha-mannosidase
MTTHTPTLHLIPNAHLDPVWLWDWREGLNEGITTCRAVLDLMDEFEELTFIRGEAVIYQRLERHDPDSFRRMVVTIIGAEGGFAGVQTGVRPGEQQGERN